MSKVYCGKCRYFIKNTPVDHDDLEYEYCDSPANYFPNYRSPTSRTEMTPRERNKFNRCKLFATKRTVVEWLKDLRKS